MVLPITDHSPHEPIVQQLTMQPGGAPGKKERGQQHQWGGWQDGQKGADDSNHQACQATNYVKDSQHCARHDNVAWAPEPKSEPMAFFTNDRLKTHVDLLFHRIRQVHQMIKGIKPLRINKK